MKRSRVSSRAAAVCALLLALLPPRAPGAETLEALPLQHRTAEELVPLLEPLLPEGAVVTGTGDVLLVRADAATLQQVRAALATLDRAPRQLLITVGQSTAAALRSSSVQGSGTTGGGDVQVGVDHDPAAAPGAEVAVRSRRTYDDVAQVASVRALENHETFIAVGSARPFTSSSVVRGHRGHEIVREQTEYRDVQTGFYATARVHGDRVTLAVAPRQQYVTATDHAPPVATRSVTTTVTGALGEWMPLGGVGDTVDESSRGVVSWATRAEATDYEVWVKVEETP